MRNWPLALVCLVAAAGNLSCGPNGFGSNPSAKPDVDPRADAALRAMSQTLAAAKSFRLHSTATIEERLESGQLAQFSRDSVILMGRPDHLQVDVRRGPDSRRIWHNGKELTVLDVRRNLYTTIETPKSNDQMIDFLAEQYNIIVPLDDLLYPNPYRTLTEHITSGEYVDRQDIDGRSCDHLLFTQDNVDWQIWIEVAAPHFPRKLVITYKDDPDQPQYEALLDDWQINPPAEAAKFKPQLPPSARRVDIADLMAAK